jgi:kynurenine formamidase
VSPSGLPDSIGIPLHKLALVAMGVDIFDNLDFERAVSEARRLNRYEFLFMASPLRIEMGTGSPLNPLAIF